MKTLPPICAALVLGLSTPAQDTTNVIAEAGSGTAGAVAAPTVPTAGTFTLDLATALRLADGRNYQIAIAREAVNESSARLRQKEYLLIPSLTVGGSWHHQEGRLQETGGRVIEVSRNAGFIGAGAGAVGAGSVAVPGAGLSANLADVYFEPIAARQDRKAARAASEAVGNLVLLQVAEAYFELVRARAAVGVAAGSLKNTAELARVTGDFARSGEGLPSDAQRARVEELFRARDLEKAEENFAVANARLAALLHLEAGVELNPAESSVAAVTVSGNDRPVTELVAAALANRPEARQGDARMSAAQSRLRQARYGPLIPNVAVNASGGQFGGGVGGGYANPGARADFNALLYWRFNNFGLGDKERANERESVLEQVRLTQAGVMDGIVAEVRQAHAQVVSRRRQIDIAAEAVETAVKSFELNRARIFQKQGLPIEALQAVQSLATAQRLHVDTVTDYNQAQFRLFTAVGQPADAAVR